MHPQISSTLNWANPYIVRNLTILSRDNAEKVLNYIEDINLGARRFCSQADPGRQPFFYRLEELATGSTRWKWRKKWLYNFFIHQKRIREKRVGVNYLMILFPNLRNIC